MQATILVLAAIVGTQQTPKVPPGTFTITFKQLVVDNQKMIAEWSVTNTHKALRLPAPPLGISKESAKDELGNVYRVSGYGGPNRLEPEETRIFTVVYDAPVQKAQKIFLFRNVPGKQKPIMITVLRKDFVERKAD